MNLGLSKVLGVLLVPTEQGFAWQSYKPLFRHPELVSFPGSQDWLSNSETASLCFALELRKQQSQDGGLR